MVKAKKAFPEGHHAVTPVLTLDNAAAAIGDSRIMLNDPMMGSKGPKALGASPVSLWIYVENCDELFDRAVAAGGRVAGLVGRMTDQFWGDRSGTFTDPR
jgi:PhnB protein